MGGADQIEAALRDVDVFAADTPNLNAWPQPNVRRQFSEWLAARVQLGLSVDELGTVRAILHQKARHISTPHTERQNLQEIIDKIDARFSRADTQRG
jgi:hypothetical protein